MNLIKRSFLVVICVSMFLSMTQVSVAFFSDVATTHVYYNAIKYVQENSIVNGYVDGTYKPEREITRAEFLKILIATRFTPDEINGCVAKNFSNSDKTIFFSDVPRTEWYANFVCIGKINNVVVGYKDGTFRPNDLISFVEAAKIIVIGSNETVAVTPVWYKAYVDKLASFNAIPLTISSFDQKITRGEMAEIVYRLKAKITTEPSWTYTELNNGTAVCSTDSDPRDAITKYLIAKTPIQKYICLSESARENPVYLVRDTTISDVQPGDEIRGIDSFSAEVDVFYWYGTSTNPVKKIFTMTKQTGNWLISAINLSTYDEASCTAAGGVWGLIGLNPVPACNLKTSDFGQVCTDSKYCDGACIAELTPAQEQQVMNGTPVQTSGECSEFTIIVGCRAFVENGVVDGILCID